MKLAALGTIVLAAGALAAAPASARQATCPAANVGDPYKVAAAFLVSAVQRRNLAASYTLASPSLRGSRSCADWAGGRVPVRAFRHIDWSRSAYEDVAGGDGQVVIRVLLYRAGDAQPTAFLMEIQKELKEPGWHVGYFARDRWYRSKPRPSARAA